MMGRIQEIKKEIAALERELKKEERLKKISKLPEHVQKCSVCRSIAIGEYEYFVDHTKFKCPICKKKTKMVKGNGLHCTKCHWDSRRKEMHTVTLKTGDESKKLPCANCNKELKWWDNYFVGAWNQIMMVCESCGKVHWFEQFVRDDTPSEPYRGRDGMFDR